MFLFVGPLVVFGCLSGFSWPLGLDLESLTLEPRWMRMGVARLGWKPNPAITPHNLRRPKRTCAVTGAAKCQKNVPGHSADRRDAAGETHPRDGRVLLFAEVEVLWPPST